MKDFFISYSHADERWAEWIAWQLEEAGYTAILQAWDFRPGSNFVEKMNEVIREAKRAIIVLSPDYLTVLHTHPEWQAAFLQDPTDESRQLLPVRVRPCELSGLLSQIVYIDLVDQSEDRAKKILLAALQSGRAKPTAPPDFPGLARPKPLDSPPFQGYLPAIWNVPFRRNPNFIRSEAIFHHLDKKLQSAVLAPVVSISGLGGIGKTQLALEYAYRHAGEYSLVWWVRAEGPETLAVDYANLAQPLQLPAAPEPDLRGMVNAVRQWLEQHSGWLLIFDNASEPEQVEAYLPQRGRGHVLITSRNPRFGGLGSALSLEVWSLDEALAFLRQRIGERDNAATITLATELGYLPLALEQASAYIEETGVSVPEYLDLLRSQRQELWARESPLSSAYPYSIATAWSLALLQVSKESPDSAELFNLCAYLAPDKIPRALLRARAAALPDLLSRVERNPLALDKALAILRRYSLVESLGETFSVNPVVQAVVRDDLREEDQARWATVALHLVENAFSFDQNDVQTWAASATLLPHALAVLQHAQDLQIADERTLRLLDQTASYLSYRTEFEQAEPLYQRALAIQEQVFGPEYPETAQSLDGLATLYKAEGRYSKAEPLYQRALAIREGAFTQGHPLVVQSLNNLAALYEVQGRYEEAAPLCERALGIAEEVLGPDHLEVAQSLNNVAAVFKEQGQYSEAEPLYQRAFKIIEQSLGPDHPEVARSLNNLAALYHIQGRYPEAEPLCKRALALAEYSFGPRHPEVARSLNNLAALHEVQGRHEEVEPLYQRALAIQEQVFGPTHPEVARILNNLAALYYAQRRYEEAEPLYQRALTIREQVFGPTHPEVAQSLNNLAALFKEQRRYIEVEPLYRRALAIQEQVFGPTHPDVAQSLNNLAALYYAQRRYEEVEPLYRRALAIQEQVFGPTHPDVAQSFNNLAAFYHAQGRNSEAEELLRRVLTIQEQGFGPDHLEVARSLNNLATLYTNQGRPTDAEPLLQRVLVLLQDVSKFGQDDRDLGEIDPKYRARVLELRRALSLYRRIWTMIQEQRVAQRRALISEIGEPWIAVKVAKGEEKEGERTGKRFENLIVGAGSTLSTFITPRDYKIERPIPEGGQDSGSTLSYIGEAVKEHLGAAYDKLREETIGRKERKH